MRKETIIFVHGAWHGKWCWEKYFKPTFVSHGYDVVLFDLPGHDKPGKIKGINKYSIGDYVRVLENEVQKLDSDPILIGHSMGGLIIQKYLEKYSCKKAILMAPVPYYGVRKSTLRYMKKSYFYLTMLGLNMYKIVDSLEKSREAFFSKELSNEDVKEYSEKLCSESFLAYINMNFTRIKINFHTKIPMLVVGGKDDTVFLESEIEDTAIRYNAELIMFDNMAHDMMLDVHQEKVSKEIIKWIERKPAGEDV